MLVLTLLLIFWHTRWGIYGMTQWVSDTTGEQGVGQTPLEHIVVAAGRHGVLWLQPPANAQQPMRLISRLDTPGSARAVVQSGNYLYVADGNRGLRVLSMGLNKTLREVGWLNPPPFAGKAIADQIAFKDNMVFLGYGTAGVQVVDVSKPEKPRDTGAWIHLDGIGGVSSLRVNGNSLYVAAGEAGLRIYDISDPRNPGVLGSFDPPQPVLDAVVVGGNAAYVAEGTGGIALIVWTNPAAPVEVAARRDLGDVRHVNIKSVENGIWIFAATAKNGVHILTYDPQKKEPFVQRSTIPWRSSVRQISLSLLKDELYLLSEKGGLATVGIQNIEAPGLIGRPYKPVPDGMGLGLLGAAFLGGSLLFGVLIGFFAQFSLPVRTIKERALAAWHLLLYVFGAHGPAIFVEDGVVRESRSESLRRGRGVILLDTASAGVLHTPGRLTRAVGPGVVFTGRRERLLGVVDLHQQTQFIGPRPGVDVFAPKAANETDEAYQERCALRDATVGLTRDGIEVVPNIIAVFRIRSEASDLKTWPSNFGYRPESVWKAVVGEGINLNEAETLPEKRRMAWNWLPAYLAVDVWREYVRRYTLIELFEARFPSPDAPSDPARNLTGAEIIAREIAARFRTSEVPMLDDFGRYQWDARGELLTMPSPEWRIMEERGLQVLTVLISNLRFPAVVEQQLVSDWQTMWEQKVGDLGGAAERTRIQQADRARMDALQSYALWTSEGLYRKLAAQEQPDAIHTLETMLSDLRDHIAEELNLRRRMTNEWDDLQDLLDWLRARMDFDER
ncbi:MAG: hypothetical protein Fur0018_18170 [Anaerolineales bacterium]